jgi:hypothetical protein
MNPEPLWFERKFDFTFPVEQYPSLRIRLWGSPVRLEEMLRSVPRNTLIEKQGSKGQQMVSPGARRPPGGSRATLDGARQRFSDGG